MLLVEKLVRMTLAAVVVDILTLVTSLMMVRMEMMTIKDKMVVEQEIKVETLDTVAVVRVVEELI